MTDQVTISTSDELRRTLAQASRIALDLMVSYQKEEGEPSDSQADAKLDSLVALRTDLTFREASLAKAFNGAQINCTATTDLRLKAYAGGRTIGNTSVVVANPTRNLVDNRYLRPRNDLFKSPGRKFEWGAGQRNKGLQLAVSILADFAGDEYALANYEKFWQTVIRNLPAQAWRIMGDQMLAWTNDHP